MLRSRFDSALPFTAFLGQVKTNAALWRDTYRLARVPLDVVARVVALPGRWHLLVIVADWCGDAVNIVPLLARVAELAPNNEWSALPKDERDRLIRTWSARDRGRTTLGEIITLIGHAVAPGGAPTEPAPGRECSSAVAYSSIQLRRGA